MHMYIYMCVCTDTMAVGRRRASARGAKDDGWLSLPRRMSRRACVIFGGGENEEANKKEGAERRRWLQRIELEQRRARMCQCGRECGCEYGCKCESVQAGIGAQMPAARKKRI